MLLEGRVQAGQGRGHCGHDEAFENESIGSEHAQLVNSSISSRTPTSSNTPYAAGAASAAAAAHHHNGGCKSDSTQCNSSTSNKLADLESTRKREGGQVGSAWHLEGQPSSDVLQSTCALW